jgi:dihydrofolate reductase
MTRVNVEITMSLDGFVAGPHATLEDPLGKGGMQLHEWVFRLASWRAQHGLEGGEHDDDDALVVRSLAGKGATVMGRRMFSGGEGPWEDDPNSGGWWGDEPPFGSPVFVVTHHPREPLAFANGTTFVFVDSVESAVAQAREAAGDKDADIAGGASIVQQALRQGLVDEVRLHVAPVLLGDGVRLFDGLEGLRLELTDAQSSPLVAHLTYRSANQ